MDVVSIYISADDALAKNRVIHGAMLAESRQMGEPNFRVIGVDDLERLFRLYDEQFFGGWLSETVASRTGRAVAFRLSSTMSRAGGKIITHRGVGGVHYEIAMASRLLFMTFGEVNRPVMVCGLLCNDRLEALQRLMEHEIIHLVELLTWGTSSCKAKRFKALASRIFGHTQSTHNLVTPRERAAVQHGVGVGDLVEFEFEGMRRVGRINRIHRRATVLVEAADGQRYSDGKRYHKFYVPLAGLRKTT